jgi:hypothetical protein
MKNDKPPVPIERFGSGVIAHNPVELAQVIEALRRSRIFWPEDLLPDPQRFLKERLGFSVSARCLVKHGQVIEAGSGIGIAQAEDLLPDPECLLEWRFGFGILAHRQIHHAKVIQRTGGLGVPRTESRCCHFDCFFRNGNRLLVFSLMKQLAKLLTKCVCINVFSQRCRACENPDG